MRIAIGGFFHESDTFNPIITGIDDFIIFDRQEIFPNRNSYLIVKGIIEYFEKLPQYQLIPLVFAKAVPNGEVDEGLYRDLKAKFFRYLEEEPPFDAFVLALHGSMRVKNIGSAETDLLRDIHHQYPNIPVFCGLDMHATITDEMLRYATALTGFKTAPHIDAYETGWQTAQMADIALRGQVNLTMGSSKVDCLIAGEKSETDCEPMRSLIQLLQDMEMDEEVCAASLLLGYPWADTAENGVTALVVTRNNSEKAQAFAGRIAHEFLQHKHEFNCSSPSHPAQEALTLALKDTCKPVFVSDSGDNPTAGSTADNTSMIHLLSNELKEETAGKKVLVAGIYDPKAVEKCRKHLNRRIKLEVGGKFDTMYCKPALIWGIPRKVVTDYGLFKSDLVLFETKQFSLILTSKHIGFTNTEMFKALEIEYMKMDVIVVKLGYLTEDFKEIAVKSYIALIQGCTDEVLSRLPYTSRHELI
ncbi:MAG TPA: M81 family metallopeptidase [Candidatus Cloacimonadota bacterium]|nr:M81 family metallopeptidase [Candidatus Cloacimonadota bacterium]